MSQIFYLKRPVAWYPMFQVSLESVVFKIFLVSYVKLHLVTYDMQHVMSYFKHVVFQYFYGLVA